MNRATLVSALAVLTMAASPILTPSAAAAAGLGYSIGGITTVSPCAGQNAEVLQAVDPRIGYVYESWMGCKGIAFARSVDGGKTFQPPISVAGSVGSNVNSWDPAVTVGPDGTVYAAFMISKNANWYPVVAASHDHGRSFDQVAFLNPPAHKNWGDREFLAVDPNHPNVLYLSYDYGPERTSVTFICAATGSCAFSTGDLNVAVQKSIDGGSTWSDPVPIDPGAFPASGGDSAPIFVEPSGRIDLLYQGYTITNTTTFTMNPAYTYYTSSFDGVHWATPVRVGPQDPRLTMSLSEWWIDGSLAVDASGNLYATWDTQDPTTLQDTGWLSFSTDHGQTWSPLVQVTPDRDNGVHIMEVAAGAPGTVYVGWLSDYTPSNPTSQVGYALYLRPFSITKGWLTTAPIRASGSIYGDVSTWPGDTFGISTLSASQVVLSWGSGVLVNNQVKSEIFSDVVTFGH
ncbi:MAG TPA: sialidase family protein [Candidatus Dormibacteraeota bacterium]